MRVKHFLMFLLMFAAAFPAAMQAQRQPASPPDTGAPLLTLDDAVSLALGNNRLVKNSVLEAQKFDFRVNTIRSQRMPHFQFAVLGGELLQPFDYTFKKGVFGTFSSTGPIPGSDTKVHNPAQFTTYVTGGMDQPLTQQYKIGLGIRATEIGRDIARENVRAERLKIAAEVRNAYYELVATQAGVDAGREAVKTLKEAQRVTAEYKAQDAVLRADALDVDARLAKSVYELTTAENGLATQREHLNQLLGRALTTEFRVDETPENDAPDLTLATARQQALGNRPEIREAHLKQRQAEYDRRIAKAQYIPDLSMSVRYLGLNNVEVLPSNVAVAGLLLTWEPFDWGRKHNAVAEKTKTVEQARNGAEETESQVAVEVGMKYRKWREAALLLQASRIGHEASAEQFRVVTNKYKEQAALIKGLLQAHAPSIEADFQYQQALSS